MSRKMTRAEYNEHMRDYMLKRYHRRRAQAVERLGGRCALCGSTQNLEFDHTDPKKKKVNIARRLAGLAEAKWEDEIKKCQLLCRECHTDKSIKEQGKTKAKGTHGTLSAYRWCGPPKCEACKEAKREYFRMWRKKRRARNT
jgi:5-methylcytosine-specific restriction endonuclease McrA